MTALAARLSSRIAKEGPIPLADFMAAALTDPDFGYYTLRDPLGARGDFVTAPEVSQMMGEMVAVWCIAMWEAIGAPAHVALVELGPGRGTLMADLLRAARIRPAFAEALDVRLVESSPVLRDAQRAALAGSNIAWHAHFADAARDTAPHPLLVIANEFFDALPIHQLVKTRNGWRERLVDRAETADAFRFVTAARATDVCSFLPPAFRDAPEGSLFEVCPAGRTLAHSIARQLVARRAAALIIDYGHAETALGDTLQALRRHRRHDPLSDPGEADITAHVDFAALAESARAAGARAFGPVSQGALLRRLGIETRAEKLCAANPGRAGEIGAALARLIGADAMGTLFKALALTDPGLGPPPGFAP
jgi:NADH dehydrogenase [ubiquinone] 1 alpha subcomplex assembly factor 7